MLNLINSLGLTAINICTGLGKLGTFFLNALKATIRTKLKLKKAFYQMQNIGVQSLSVVALTGASTGGVLAYQAYQGLSRFNGEQFLAPIVFISMVREFGPVLAAIMVAARAGSAMTAEIGTMKITEQIDALKTLCINPYQYLIIPRLVASTLILPYLSLFCSLFGIIAGYIVSVYLLGINSELYMKSIRENVELYDITSGLIKATVFGFLLSWIASYKGYTTEGGARGVGISTTQSVVYACITIFIADYVLTALLFQNN
ncbi:ABC transporter permease [Candidatus Babeliales bacterium]|nr:ABC transporter permease [Candidatus Babeliales bacterium]